MPGFFSHGTVYPPQVFFALSTTGQAKYLHVDLKGKQGEVDLAFKNVDGSVLRQVLATLPKAPGDVVINGRSSEIRISGLETFVISEGMAVIPTKVLPAYRAAHRLLTFWQENRSAFDLAVEAGRTPAA